MFRFKETLNVDKNKLIFYRMSLLVHSLPNFHFPFPDSLYRILLENPHLRFYLSNLTVTASCFLGLVQGESMYFFGNLCSPQWHFIRKNPLHLHGLLIKYYPT